LPSADAPLVQISFNWNLKSLLPNRLSLGLSSVRGLYSFLSVFLFVFLNRQSVNFSFFVSILMSVRETCADWHRGVDPQADPALKGKKDPEGFAIKVPRRNVGKYRHILITSLKTIELYDIPTFQARPRPNSTWSARCSSL